VKIETSCFDIAQRYVGVEETPGAMSNPLVLAMLQLDAKWPKGDDVPWCSGFANWVAWHLRLPRSKSLGARTWLLVGRPIALEDAEPENDVVILKRGGENQPGPDVIKANGHVGFYAGVERSPKDAITHVLVIGGNQSDAVTVDRFQASRVLGVRRLTQ
jgi:uncharacterized protein (TIGR02594 family)